MASRPSTRSSNPKTTKKRTSGRTGQPPRPQRDDTAEAREQERRAPKTHPTRAAGARRKPATRHDKGDNGNAAASPSPSPRKPAMKRREKRGQKRRNSPS
jgi:hypothetical protein